MAGGPYNGRVYIAYMSREGSSDYDIFIRHSDNQGLTWSGSRRINDDTFGNGRDQFHVWLTVDNLGTVSAVWLDRRHDTQNLAWHCYVSQSTDGGLTWSANQQVSTAPSHPNQTVAEPGGVTAGRDSGPQPDEAGSRAGVIGEYIGIACWDGFVTPVWVDTRNGNQDTNGGNLPNSSPVDDAGSRTVVSMRISPNPSGGPFTLDFAVPRDGRVSLELFDLAGRRVRTLVDRNLQGGEHHCVWDGHDQAGRRASAGTYLARLRTEHGQESRRVTLAR